jgi:hypothetical protein
MNNKVLIICITAALLTMMVMAGLQGIERAKKDCQSCPILRAELLKAALEVKKTNEQFDSVKARLEDVKGMLEDTFEDMKVER